MRVRGRFIVVGALAVVCANPNPNQSLAQMRAVALQGDPAPGVAGATFTGFSAFQAQPVCDASGHAAFGAITSAGPGGLWTDDLGTLSLLALGGASVPWYPGTASLSSLGQAILSDDHRVAVSGTALTPSLLYGVWIQDGAGIALAAGTGVPAPTYNGPSTFNLVPPPSGNMVYRFSRNGRLGLMGGDGAGTACLWTVDPPPTLGRQFCAAALGATLNPDFWSFTYQFVFNNEANYSLQLVYHNISNNWWVAQGGCGLLAPVLANGDVAPPVGTIPASANIAAVQTNVPPDLNGANAIVFPSTIYNGGVTAANDEVYWLRDATGFHVIAREGDSDPALGPGESIWPYFLITGGTPPRLLLSDDGSVAFEGEILPSNTAAVFVRRPDGTLHVLARDGGAVPGYPGWTFSFPVGTPIEMNHFGQVLVQATVWTPGHTSYGTALFATDDNSALQPVFLNGSTYTVRPGLTGSVLMNQLYAAPFSSGGSDGQPRNFSDFGEFFFQGTIAPAAGVPALSGVFAVRGPALTLAVGPDAAPATRLDPVAPNPTMGPSRIDFELAHAGEVRLEILDLAGRRVKTLRNGQLPAGRYSERWAGDDDAGHSVARGIYFVRLLAGGESIARRMVVVQK